MPCWLWCALCISDSPVRYAKFESIRYFIDIDILLNCLIDIDIFQNQHIDIDIFGIALSISISIFFRIALSISISISIFSTSPYRYRYRYFSKVSIYRQSICHIDISNRATSSSSTERSGVGEKSEATNLREADNFN